MKKGRDITQGLSDATLRAAKPKDKAYSLTDIRGLHVQIMPSGRKFWRMRYAKSDGRMSWHTIGEYPAISIIQARAELPKLRQRAKEGLPLREDKERHSFASIAEAWMNSYTKRGVSDGSVKRVRSGLSLHILPYLGRKDITKITPRDVIDVLQRLADDGKHTTMVNVRTFISQIFRYASTRGIVTYDPCSMTIGAIPTPPPKHFPTLRNPADVARLLKSLDLYPHKRARLLTLFAVYSLLRPGEARRIEWADIDTTASVIRIASEKMKMKRTHIVPMSRQLAEIIEAMRPISENGRYVFPNKESGDRPMNKSTMRLVLDASGFTREEITPHGFRGMASTILNENGYNSDWIERQLAHVEGNKVRAAYNYADFLDDRRTMLQWYADYLDGLRGSQMNLEG